MNQMTKSNQIKSNPNQRFYKHTLRQKWSHLFS